MSKLKSVRIRVEDETIYHSSTKRRRVEIEIERENKEPTMVSTVLKGEDIDKVLSFLEQGVQSMQNSLIYPELVSSSKIPTLEEILEQAKSE